MYGVYNKTMWTYTKTMKGSICKYVNSYMNLCSVPLHNMIMRVLAGFDHESSIFILEVVGG